MIVTVTTGAVVVVVVGRVMLCGSGVTIAPRVVNLFILVGSHHLACYGSQIGEEVLVSGIWEDGDDGWPGCWPLVHFNVHDER